jgi:hypothetical protein
MKGKGQLLVYSRTRCTQQSTPSKQVMGTAFLIAIVGAIVIPEIVRAQGSPMPGNNASYPSANDRGTYSAPVPGNIPQGQSQPLSANVTSRASNYQLLPISQADAKIRIDELKNLVIIARPQDIQDRVHNLCEWLTDITEAHNKLANVFSRQDSTKAQAQAERSYAQKFAQLKNEAVLIKAELLIKQNRAPEALGPLVDIVVNDPKGATGQAAYRRLKELGFSPEPGESMSTNGQPADHLVVSQGSSMPASKKGTQGLFAPINRQISQPVR